MAIRSLKNWSSVLKQFFSLKEGTRLSDSSCAGAGWLSGSIIGRIRAQREKRRFYRITKKGRKELDRQKEEWKEYAGAVGKVLQLQNA